MKEKPQSLESQLQMARPRRAEVKRVPLTPEEKEFLGEIMKKAVAAEKRRHLAEALKYYQEYKDELLIIKEKRKEEARLEKLEKMWNMERLIEWAKTDVGIADAKMWVEQNFKVSSEGKVMSKGGIDLSGKDLKELPKGIVFIGNLILRYSKIRKMPEGFSVDGNLNLEKAKIKRLPSGLNIGNNLILRESQVELMGENTVVDGRLDLVGSKLQNLPENLTVIGNLFAKDLKNINGIPKGLRVEGDLNLKGTGIRKIPDNLRVGGRLLLMDTPISEIGNNANIEGSLILTNTKIQKIGNNLKVGKDLLLGGCSQIKSLPRSIEVGGKVDLRGMRIGILPPLYVKGDLNISSMPILRNLPANLRVDGDINVDLCKKKVFEKAKKLKEQGKIKGEVKGQPDPRPY